MNDFLDGVDLNPGTSDHPIYSEAIPSDSLRSIINAEFNLDNDAITNFWESYLATFGDDSGVIKRPPPSWEGLITGFRQYVKDNGAQVLGEGTAPAVAPAVAASFEIIPLGNYRPEWGDPALRNPAELYDQRPSNRLANEYMVFGRPDGTNLVIYFESADPLVPTSIPTAATAATAVPAGGVAISLATTATQEDVANAVAAALAANGYTVVGGAGSLPIIPGTAKLDPSGNPIPGTEDRLIQATSNTAGEVEAILNMTPEFYIAQVVNGRDEQGTTGPFGKLKEIFDDLIMNDRDAEWKFVFENIDPALIRDPNANPGVFPAISFSQDAAYDSFMRRIFLDSFAAFLRDSPVFETETIGSIGNDEFVDAWREWMVQTTVITEEMTSAGLPSNQYNTGDFTYVGTFIDPANFPSLETVFNNIYRDIYTDPAKTPAENAAALEEAFHRRLMTFVTQRTARGGYFIPSHHAKEFGAELVAEAGLLQKMSHSPEEITRRSMLWVIFDLLLIVMQRLQRTVQVQGQNLIFLTDWQKQYTDLMGRVPLYQGNPTKYVGPRTVFGNEMKNLIDAAIAAGSPADPITPGSYNSVPPFNFVPDNSPTAWANAVKQYLKDDIESGVVSGIGYDFDSAPGVRLADGSLKVFTNLGLGGASSVTATIQARDNNGNYLFDASGNSTTTTITYTLADQFVPSAVLSSQWAQTDFWTAPGFAGITLKEVHEYMVDNGISAFPTINLQINEAGGGEAPVTFEFDPFKAGIPGVWWLIEQPYGTDSSDVWNLKVDRLGEKRASINDKRNAWIDRLRSSRNIIRDIAKQQQSDLSQTKEAINQQAQLMTSILQLLGGIIQAIFR